MTTILGLDISSYALHGCLLVPSQPPVLRMEKLGKQSEPLIERVRRVYWALDTIINGSNPYLRAKAPDWVVVEDAYGSSGKARKALDLVTGAIIASAPASSQVALLRCADWRAALGAEKNTKEFGHIAVWAAFARGELLGQIDFVQRGVDSDELDAIGIALAWSRILDAHGEEAA